MTRVLFLAAAALLAQGPAPSAPQAAGPSPADLYHTGARAFVNGENGAARRAVEAGLARAPGDARLQALKDLVDQQDQEGGRQDGGQQDPSDNSDPGEQGQDGEQGENGEGSPDRPEDGQDAEPDQTRTAPPPQAAEGGAPPARPRGEMSAAQAERILDAVGGEERLLLRELRRAPSQRSRSDKDW